MFDDISTREIIIFGIIICLVIFAIYLFTETRSLRETLDSMDDGDDEDEPEEKVEEISPKEEAPYVINGPRNP